MPSPARPRRQRKSDRLITPDATKNEIICDYSIAPLDRLAIEYDQKWGIDCLPELVSPEMAAKYGSAMAHLNECIREGDPAKCTAAAENCMKGLNAMDAAATAAGKPQATGCVFEFAVDDFKFGVLEDEKQWHTAQERRPDLRMFTQREVAMAVKAYLNTPLLPAAKEVFPGATVTKITPKQPPCNFAAGGDAIPF